MIFRKKISNKAQVWIETAVYTLIGLTIIGILLASAAPQIEKIKDRSVISQTSEALNKINSKIIEIEQAPANSREIQIAMSKGKLEINSNEGIIQYVLEDSRLKLTELNETIEEGNIFILTKQRGARYDIYLTLNYTNRINMTFNGKKETKNLQSGTTPYRLVVENVGDNSLSQKTHIDFNLI